MSKKPSKLIIQERGFGMSRMLDNWRNKLIKKGYKTIIVNDRINDADMPWKYIKEKH